MPGKKIELPSSPGLGKGPGWYQVGPNPNDQAHWDGEEWTARRRWAGARWVDLPLVELLEEEEPEKRRGLLARLRRANGNGAVVHLSTGDAVQVVQPAKDDGAPEHPSPNAGAPEVAEREVGEVGQVVEVEEEPARPPKAAPKAAAPKAAPRRTGQQRRGPQKAGGRKAATAPAGPPELLRPGIARQRRLADEAQLEVAPLELVPAEEGAAERAPLRAVAFEEPPEQAAPEQVAVSRRARLLRTFAIVATVGAIGLWLLAIQNIHASGIGAMGFINAVHPSFFVASTLLVLAFASALAFPHPPRWLLVLQVITLIAMLYATVVIVEPLPRFGTSWVHAGFTDFIATHGKTLPSYDARFNWPGFFATAAMLSKAAGLRSPVDLLKWAPVFFNVLYAVGIYAVASTVTKNVRAKWLAVWLFLSCNWVGQDYFSPQGFSALLAICCMVIILRWFRTPVPDTVGSRFPRIVSLLRTAPDELPAQEAGRNRKLVLLGLLTVMFGAVVVSHQLTPPVMVLWVAALVVAMRLRLTTMPLVLGTIFLVWLSFGTVIYWSGHLKDIFGGTFQLGSTLNQSLTSRVRGSASRISAQHITIAFTAFIYFLAGFGFLRRLRAGYGEGTIALLALAPFSVIFLQSYGGEALLRTVFLGLPFLAVLGAMAFFPRPTLPGVGKVLCLAAVLTAAVPLLLLARYSNESWEYETPAELADFQYVYDNAPQGSVLVGVANEMFWGYRDVGKIKLQGNTALSDPAVAETELSVHAPAAYLIVTRSQVAYGHYSVGLPANWARNLENALLATGRYRIVFSNGGGQVLARVQGGHKS